ncbi:MAG: hypothetical protein ISQ32_01215 [Rickettsiales bacterium]|nr:hypothetical protein [Rickettsiales bacterium]
MQNFEIEKLIVDIYGLKQVSFLPPSNLVIFLIFFITFITFGYIFARRYYLKQNPSIRKLLKIKKQIKQLNKIELNQLSILCKKIAYLKYNNSQINQMNFYELINYIHFVEKNNDFDYLLIDLDDNLYSKQNIIIKDENLQNIVKVLLKWI